MRRALVIVLVCVGCHTGGGRSSAPATAAVVAAPDGVEPAAPEAVEMGPVDPQGPGALSGTWTGTFLYNSRNPAGGPASVSFFAELILDARGLRGSIVEPNSFGDDVGGEVRASVQGVIEADGEVRFTKQYDGTAGVTHVVEFVGFLDLAAARIEGAWTTAGASGSFVMKRDRPLPRVAMRPVARD
jgi:hypothetical protein